MFWIYALVPLLAAALVIALARRASWSRFFEDRPNERSLHARPTPRLGGIGVMAASLPFLAAVATPPLAAIAAGALFLAIVSLLDDIRSLPIEVRLPAHAIAAGVAVLALGGHGAWGWLEAGAAAVAIVWMTNLFNFMDGADGLAGGMAAIGFGALAFAAHIAGEPAIALGSLAIAAAAAGFLAHNLPPARVFLGDAGSVPLGFLAGAVGAYGAAVAAWPAWFPLLVFSPFIVDATVTIVRRLLRGERIWKAHRSHYYQRLVLAGWSRRRLLAHAYVLMLAAAASALAALGSGWEVRCAILLAWFAVYVSLLAAIERRVGRPQGPS